MDRLHLAVVCIFSTAPLFTHLNWDCCSCSSGSYTGRNLTWPALGGETKSVISHMIDIVDSIDVQVAYIKNSTMVFRSAPAYNYWDSKIGKSNSSRAYVLLYTNPTSLCQTNYSPHVIGNAVTEDSCAFTTKSRTENGMYMGFDYVESNHPMMKGSIHFMNGVYGSGVTDEWPMHTMPFPIPYCVTKMPTAAPTNKPKLQSCTVSSATVAKNQSTTTDVIQMFEDRSYSSGGNAITGGIASQSSTYRGEEKFGESNAIDGSTSTFSHTDQIGQNAWWQVEFNQSPTGIESIQILNRFCKNLEDIPMCMWIAVGLILDTRFLLDSNLRQVCIKWTRYI